MITTRVVLECDKVNENGRVYPKEVVVKAVRTAKNKIKKKELFGTLATRENSEIVKLGDITFIVLNMFLRRGKLLATIETIDTPQGRLLQELIGKDMIDFKTSGIGEVTPSGIVENFEITSLTVSLKKEMYGNTMGGAERRRVTR